MNSNNGNIRINYQYNFTLPPGVEGPKLLKCIPVILLFFITNVLFMIFDIVKFIKIEIYTTYNIIFFVLALALAIGFVGLAVFFLYKYVFVAIIKAGYKYATPFFKTVSMMIAERFANDEHFKEKIDKAFDFGKNFGNAYDSKSPWIIKKAAGFLINRLPFVDFIKNLSPDIKNKDMRAVSEAIYVQMDEYIVKKLFPNNNMNWALVLYPVNLAVQILLLFLIK